MAHEHWDRPHEHWDRPHFLFWSYFERVKLY